MKAIRIASVFLCLTIVVLVMTYNVILVRIPLGKVGVLTQQYDFLGEKGVVAEDFGPGWHRDFGPLHSWVVFDSTVQTTEMGRRGGRGVTRGVTRGGSEAVRLKSTDGYNVSLDITVKFRILPGSAHKLYKDSGSEQNYKLIVRNMALDTFREVFGEMKTEDFYNPQIRHTKTVAAKTKLSTRLKKRHVELIDILIREIAFDPGYEKKIREKKLADQDVELYRSESLAAEKRGETQVILIEAEAMVKVIARERDGEVLTMQARTDKQIAQITADAEKYATETRADADLIAAELIAQGTLAIAKAEAEGERLKAAALQGSGGANLVALEGARSISLSDMTLSTVDTDFLNIESMTRMLGARAE